jgi:hypothetical protein
MSSQNLQMRKNCKIIYYELDVRDSIPVSIRNVSIRSHVQRRFGTQPAPSPLRSGVLLLETPLTESEAVRVTPPSAEVVSGRKYITIPLTYMYITPQRLDTGTNLPLSH